MLLLDVTLAPLGEGGVIELEMPGGADHDFRDPNAGDLVDRSVEFIKCSRPLRSNKLA